MLKILIAEDDETSILHLKLSLRAMEYELLFANNGADTITMCRQNEDLDMLLLDIKMPNVNGIEVIKEIRTYNKELIIIIQTAYYATDFEKEAMEAGCNEFLNKPVSKTILINTINKYFPQ